MLHVLVFFLMICGSFLVSGGNIRTLKCDGVSCEKVTCPEPRILPGECCPVCQTKGKNCVVGGKTYKDGENFYIDCNGCSCSNGNVICTLINCGIVKPGTCPSSNRKKPGVCATMCLVDSDCPDTAKCCRNGCGGSSCEKPSYV